MHPFYKAQIALLIANKVSIEVFKKYVRYVDIFFKKTIVELPKYTKINDYPIDLEEGKQPLYGPIYNLRLIELKTLKTYIKNNLKNRFIRLLKFLTGTPILYIKKTNSFLFLCIDYQGLNNLTIKN